MNFINFRNKLTDHFNQMSEENGYLFTVEVDKDEMCNLYLDSFPKGSNEIYRERRAHDCSCCRSFIKGIGAVVSIKNNKITTIWRFDTGSDIYQPVVDALDAFIKSKVVNNVFIAPFSKYGALETFEEMENGDVKRWNHLHVCLPDRFVKARDIESIRASFRDTRNVFKRSLDEISEEAVMDVLDLIKEGALYRGDEWEHTLEVFHTYQAEYKVCPDEFKDNFAWEKSVQAGPIVGRIRNHSIGTLLVNLSEGMELELALKKFDEIVAPCNYKRNKAPYTPRMAEAAKKTVTELGYMDSLQRRHATMDDITINNILFADRDSVKRMNGAADIFDEMIKDAPVNPTKFDKVDEVHITDFIKDMIPTAKEISVLFENKHIPNLVSLIAPINKDSATMFKWGNNFGWSYTGNMTDSMKQRVKDAGGKVDGVLRFSIQWNENGTDNCDLDAHCIEPTGNRIFFGNCKKPYQALSGGQLDVDVRWPRGEIAVENITWPDIKSMHIGTYSFIVNQYEGSARGGFRAEIEYDGQIHSFDYNKSLRPSESVEVASVTLDKYGNFDIINKLPATTQVSSKDVWGVNTNTFIPVSMVMLSPNYWDENDGIGNKHYFFMMKNCVNPEQPNGFFNEFLKEELRPHRKVFEVLGEKMRVDQTDDQLSGIGFSSTLRNDIVVKIKTDGGERVVRIKF